MQNFLTATNVLSTNENVGHSTLSTPLSQSSLNLTSITFKNINTTIVSSSYFRFKDIYRLCHATSKWIKNTGMKYMIWNADQSLWFHLILVAQFDSGIVVTEPFSQHYILTTTSWNWNKLKLYIYILQEQDSTSIQIFATNWIQLQFKHLLGNQTENNNLLSASNSITLYLVPNWFNSCFTVVQKGQYVLLQFSIRTTTKKPN